MKPALNGLKITVILTASNARFAGKLPNIIKYLKVPAMPVTLVDIIYFQPPERSSVNLLRRSLTWFKIINKIYSSNGNVSVRQIQKEFGVTYKTAWRMVKKTEGFLKENSSACTSEIRTEKSGSFDAPANKSETNVEAASAIKV